MDTDMTFSIDAQLKDQLCALCSRLGITPADAFRQFALAFVQAGELPFPAREQAVSRQTMKRDTEELLREFAADYKRMAE